VPGTLPQLKIDEQRAELESRSVSVHSIQRNFEDLSQLVQRERSELTQLRAAHKVRGRVGFGSGGA
jgi:hypothetical protein